MKPSTDIAETGNEKISGPCFRNGEPMERPTLDNWLKPPYLFWSARHAKEILNTATVSCGTTPSALQNQLDESLLNLSFVGVKGSQWVLRDYLEQTQTDSLVVIKDGSIRLDWRANRVGDNERHLLFSVTKSLTGLLCGALIGNNLIDANAPVVRYVPELSQSAFSDANIRNLLDMEASFLFSEDYAPGDDLTAYYKAAGYLPATEEEAGLHKYLLKLKRDPAEPFHGKRFRYLTPTTDVLSWVCEAASGLSYAEALSKYVWIPMGAECPADAPIDRFGSSRGSGGLSASPRDAARFGMIIAQDGAGIVPSEFIDDLTKGGNQEHWAKSDVEFSSWLPGGCYRSCWYQPRVDPECVMAVGIRGQMIYVDRVRGVAVAKLSSWDEPDPIEMQKDAEEACRTICRAL